MVNDTGVPMANVIHYLAHPGLVHSQVNAAMWARAQSVNAVTHVDLFAEYPRYHIDIDAEQERLTSHDVIVLQFPLFWYSCPGLMKEWIDLVLEHGFAYGTGGDKLAGKSLMLAVTTGGPQDAYTTTGYQHFELRTFLTPFEQTANLCQMQFLAPYVMHSALKDAPEPHAAGFERLLSALAQDRLDLAAARAADILTHDTLPITPASEGV